MAILKGLGLSGSSKWLAGHKRERGLWKDSLMLRRWTSQMQHRPEYRISNSHRVSWSSVSMTTVKTWDFTRPAKGATDLKELTLQAKRLGLETKSVLEERTEGSPSWKLYSNNSSLLSHLRGLRANNLGKFSFLLEGFLQTPLPYFNNWCFPDQETSFQNPCFYFWPQLFNNWTQLATNRVKIVAS